MGYLFLKTLSMRVILLKKKKKKISLSLAAWLLAALEFVSLLNFYFSIIIFLQKIFNTVLVIEPRLLGMVGKYPINCAISLLHHLLPF